MERELAEYHSGRASYARIAQTIPELYAQGLRNYSAPRHLEIATEYITSIMFLSSVFPVAHEFFNFITRSPRLRGVIISGGPSAVLTPYGELVGITDVRALEVEVRAGCFTGILIDNPAKFDRKESIISQINKTEVIVLAVGDSESDQPMLTQASYRVTFGDMLAREWENDLKTLALRHDASDDDPARLRSFLRGIEEQWAG
jgi:phosphoserine phosphatase